MVTIKERHQVLDWLVNNLMSPEALAHPLETRDFSADDWAYVVEGVPHEFRPMLWRSLLPASQPAILCAMRDDARKHLLAELASDEVNELLALSSADQLLVLYEQLPSKLARQVISELPKQARSSVKDALSYHEDQLGRYVNHDVVTVLPQTLVADVLLDLKQRQLPPYTDVLVVMDEQERYLGLASLDALFSASRKVAVSEVMMSEVGILPNVSLLDASNRVKASGLSMLPVVDEQGILLGRFSLRDSLDVMQEHYEEQLSHMGNVSDEDLFAPVAISARRRAVWLGINLATAFLASAVIGLFEAVLVQVVALAVLMPIVASMGGITGSQTLTLTIRGLATGQLSAANLTPLANKELRVAAINAVLWAAVVGVVAAWWFGNGWLAFIIILALVVNMLVAVVSGIVIPVILNRVGIDPALAGSVILTTVTDVVGFFVFLGSATLLFL
jgi:magnesium transporter